MKKSLSYFLFGWIFCLGAFPEPVYAKSDEENQSCSEGAICGSKKPGTVTYGKDFFARFPNAVSVVDIIRRIPGGSQILGSTIRQGSNNYQPTKRGFSNNDDRVLINGKRISGKGNNSAGALERINIDKVLRIDIIRGGSPDIKVSSQEAIVNVIIDGSLSSGSGAWKIKSKSPRYKNPTFGGSLSYGSSIGALDYFLSADSEPKTRRMRTTETYFGATDIVEGQLVEGGVHYEDNVTLSSNFTYKLENGDEIKLNGQYKDMGSNGNFPGLFYEPDENENLMLAGEGLRVEEQSKPSWEIGLDYGTPFADNLDFKILGLYSVKNEDRTKAEDYLITPPEAEFDVKSIRGKRTKEAIARTSLVWGVTKGHDLEVGTEISVNKMDSNLLFFEIDNGVLVEQVVDVSSLAVKENRNESFIIHTWKMNPKISLESAIFTEYSSIGQEGVGVDAQKNLFFLRPSTDFRYNIDNENQFQLSVRRKVEQLDFQDFASTVSQDDKIVAGNVDLEPQKSWEVEVSYEHRLKKDRGSIKARIFHEAISDYTQRIEISTGRSGVGNSGKARINGLEVKGNIRLWFLGLPSFVLESRLQLRDTEATDPFTGEKRQMAYREKMNFDMSFRHDLNDLGISYGADYTSQHNQRQYDIDELIITASPRERLKAFIEGKVFGNMSLMLEFSSLPNTNYGRERILYDNGVATGEITGRELMERRAGRTFYLTLKGAF